MSRCSSSDSLWYCFEHVKASDVTYVAIHFVQVAGLRRFVRVDSMRNVNAPPIELARVNPRPELQTVKCTSSGRDRCRMHAPAAVNVAPDPIVHVHARTGRLVSFRAGPWLASERLQAERERPRRAPPRRVHDTARTDSSGERAICMQRRSSRSGASRPTTARDHNRSAAAHVQCTSTGSGVCARMRSSGATET